MAKKNNPGYKPGQPSESQELPGSEAGYVEYDPSRSDSAELASVQELDGEASISSIDDGLHKAQKALEEHLGLEAFNANAVAELSDSPASTRENIVGLGLGEKVVNGRYTGELAVKVFVAEKLSPSEIEEEAMVPEAINGYPTDVEEVGDVSALRYTGRYRPAPGGSSVGHFRITAGTLGALIVRNNGHVCILSNNHVLANSNSARLGDAILQPGPIDGGRDPRDRIGTLEAFVPIHFGGVTPNDVDCAAAFTNRTLVSPKQHAYAINPTPVAVGLGSAVRKCGRTTQATLGQVTAVSVSIRVNYGTAGVALFRNQIQIRGTGGVFSQGGDSGSLIVSAGTRQPAALLFAGGGDFTFANPIRSVIAALGIRQFVA